MKMQYFGGKQRIATNLASFLQPFVTQSRGYVEPFVGSGAVMCKIKHEYRIASDINEALITLWQALKNGWEPPSIVTEEMYVTIMRKCDKRDPLTAFVGFGCSFAGKWFGGYARGATGRNYAMNAKNSLRKKLLTLQGVDWRHHSYEKTFQKDMVIYCDPGTTQYGAAPVFDWDQFWNWVRITSQYNLVFVSEYKAPSDFEIVTQFNTKLDVHVRTNENNKRTKRLFKFRKGIGS